MSRKIKYYDLRRNWRKVKRHLDNPRVADTLVRDFNKYTYGRWRRRFTAGRHPFRLRCLPFRLAIKLVAFGKGAFV